MKKFPVQLEHSLERRECLPKDECNSYSGTYYEDNAKANLRYEDGVHQSCSPWRPYFNLSEVEREKCLFHALVGKHVSLDSDG